MASSNFVISKELALSTDIRIASWCPTMDLCAVVSSDGQLQLHRMDWQLLWAASPDALITAVCWRPDGKEIAVGHANGAISVLDVESGEATAEHKGAHYAGIRSLSWVDQAAPACHHATSTSSSDILFSCNKALQAAAGTSSGAASFQFSSQHSIQPHQRYKRLFAPPILEPHPPSSTEPLPDPYDMCLQAAGVAAWPTERPGLSLLTAADVRGRVSLWLQGQVQVAEVAGNAVCSREDCFDEGDDGGRDGAVSAPLQLLHVAPSSNLDRMLMVNRTSAGGVLVVCQTLQLLQQQQQPLQQCTALFSQLQTFLKASVRCLEVCSQDWTGALADFHKRFDAQLRQELTDQGCAVPVPQQELVLLLATGSCTPALQSFLSSTLGEANLRRLARSLDSTANGLHTALLERVQPLLELVLFLLGELRGCVVAAGAAAAAAAGEDSAAGGLGVQGWMGLQANTLQQLELHAAALLLRNERLRRAVTAVTCQYRAFFTWLLKTLRQLDGSDGSQADGSSGSGGGSSNDASTPLPVCQQILEFLKGQFLHDVIGPELLGSPVTPEAQALAEALFYQGISPPEAQQLLALLMDWSLPAAASSSSRQQPEGPSPAALELAAEACRRPLSQQLQHLVSCCEDAFEAPLMVISPSIRAISQLQLLPAAAAAAAAGEQQEVLSPSTAAGSSASGCSQAVAVGLPLLQPKQLEDRQTYVVCVVPGATADNPDCSQLLLVRFPDALVQQQQQQQQQSLAAEAVLLQLDPGQSAVAWSCYKEQQLALLTQVRGAAAEGASNVAGGSSGSSILYLVQLMHAPWLALQTSTAAHAGSSAAEQCQQQQAIAAVSGLPHRQRQLQVGVTEQLSVSRARGLGSLVTDMQHLLLMDLEDDEEGEGEEEQDDGDDDAVDDDDADEMRE